MIRHLFPGLAFALALSACSSIDCPLDNQVEMTLAFYDANTLKALPLPDTLSVYGLNAGSEQLLYNRGIAVKTVKLTLRPQQPTDTFLLRFTSPTQTATDTLWVDHESQPHFEALDCPASTFHTLHALRWKGHDLNLLPLTVDSAAISHSNVRYEDVENLKVFLRTTPRQ